MGDIIQLPEIRQRAARFRLVTALLERGLNVKRRERIEAVELSEEQIAYPRWWSGVSQVDRLLGDGDGGFQGMTAIGAPPGHGKSTLALGAGTECARQGDLVLLFDSENGSALTRTRLLRRLYQNLDELAEISGSTLFYLPVSPEDELQSISRAVLERFRLDHKGILVIVDSVNSVVEMLVRGENEFRNHQQFLAWADWIVRQSNGFVRFLLVSELNKEGGLRGVKIGYRAQVTLGLKRPPDEGHDVVEITCLKNRDGRAGRVGVFTLDWRHSRFNWLRP